MAPGDQSDRDTPRSSEANPSKVDQRRAFGAKLKAAREGAGMTVAAMSQVTRITHAFIETMEAGDFDRLPGAVFGRGFVKGIARATDKDVDAYIAEFNSLWDREPPKSVLQVQIKNKPMINRGENLKNMMLTASSLMKRGAGLMVLGPIAAILIIGYLVVTNPTLRTALKGHLSSGAASLSVPAKTLDLQPKQDEVEPEAVAPQTAPGAATDAAATNAATVASTSETVKTKETAALASTATASASTAAAPVVDGAHVAKTAGDQYLELTVTEPVRVRLDVDGGQTVTKELTPDTYKFNFVSRADVMVYDAAALKISFNGRSLGSLGSKGRVRRLSFEAAPASPNKL